MFERTRSGQQNRALFFGVDLVCYVEGGGETGEAAPDITFWTGVFAVLRPDKKIRCVPRGGKPILERLANEIVNQNLADTIVAMDSDYDDFRGRKIEDSRVFYTYGYSWENDLYSQEGVRRTFCALRHCSHVPNDVDALVSRSFNSLRGELERPIRADFLALCAGSSVLPRQSPGRVIGHSSETGLPYVKRTEVLQLIGLANGATRPRRTSSQSAIPGDPIRYCVGHVLALAAAFLLRAALRMRQRRASLSAEHSRDVALQAFPQLLVADPNHPVSVHHMQQCARLI